MLEITIPLPPSTNALYVVRDGRRRKTSEYNKWLKVARVFMMGAERFPVKTSLRVDIDAAISRRRDIDNIIKPILDCLQPMVIPDDRWVDVVEARRVLNDSSLQEGYCRVSVYS